MAQRARSYFFRAASALALALLIAGCTKGGQFDPTEIFSSDVFDSKKKLKGERQPVFPEGVPGASTGVPADLVKGYEPPPEQPDPDAAVPGPTPPAAAEAAKPKPHRNRLLPQARLLPQPRRRRQRGRLGSQSARHRSRHRSNPTRRFGRPRRRRARRNPKHLSRFGLRHRRPRRHRRHSPRTRSGLIRRPRDLRDRRSILAAPDCA
jgi:hypothetical protein